MNWETTETTTEGVITETGEVTLEGLGPDWTDYLDLGLKALLVIAAFAIYFRF